MANRRWELAAVIAVTFGIAGCVPLQAPDLNSSPSPRAVFESDDEALSAAAEAYSNYQNVESVITADGGIRPDRIEAVAVRDALRSSLEASAKFRKNNFHSVGNFTYKIVGLEQYKSDPTAVQDVVSVYLCLDVSGIDIVNRGGKSVVSPDRVELQSFEVGFDAIQPGSEKLIVSSRETWTGNSLCEN